MNHPLHLVAGLGKTGLSIARYLHRNNKPFIAFDTRKDAPGLTEFKLAFPNICVYLEEIPQNILALCTDIIASPGLSLELPFLKQAIELGIAVYGDIECLAREITAPVIAITGTNGKSTVTTLVGEMAKAAGFRVAVAGNIGKPVLDLLEDDYQYDLWVLELSSFQLDLTYSLAPAVATILNISPDHLDRHHTLNAYIQSKQRVYHQANIAVFNRDDDKTIPCKQQHCTRICLSFGKEPPKADDWGLLVQRDTVYLAKGNTSFLAAHSLLIKGVHNWLNALAACALAESVGISSAHQLEVLKTFSGLPHRCQWVRSLDEVEWINDSKVTNIGATISAITGIGEVMQGKIVLIAGGQGKGADFSDLSAAVAKYVRCIVLIGEDADKIESALTPIVPIERATSLEAAVARSKDRAKPGDVVLLSPACASLDMFRDFNHRGELFNSLVHRL